MDFYSVSSSALPNIFKNNLLDKIIPKKVPVVLVSVTDNFDVSNAKSMAELNEAQIIKGLIKAATCDDFDEVKSELKALREEVMKLQASSTGDRLLKISDLVKKLQLSKPSIYELIDSGKLVPAVLLEQHPRFREADVNQMVENSLRPKQTSNE